MISKFDYLPLHGKIDISNWVLFQAGMVYIIPLSALLIWKPVLGIAFGCLPILILLLVNGVFAVYLLIIGTFLFLPMQFTVTFLPADVCAMILVLAYFIDIFLGRRTIIQNHLFKPYLIYLLIVVLSALLNGATALSIKFIMRQILLFMTFMAVCHYSPRLNIKHVFISFAIVAAANSLLSTMQFLVAGGGIRTFGLAGRGYGDHVMLGMLICLVYYLWSSDIRERVFWTICGIIISGALAATQTRASAITAGIGIVLIISFSLRYSFKKNLAISRNNLIHAAILVAAVIPIILIYTPLLDGILYRFGRIGLQASGTILLRFTLWTAALKAFWANPIWGIGPGNFAQIYLWLPEVKFDPIFYMVSGLSTHAIVMTVLSETGIFGFLSLGYFFFKAIRVSYGNFISVSDTCRSADTLILFVIASVITISSIYSGSWFWGNNSYHMAIVFGVIAASEGERIKFKTRGCLN
ncbi:MAG: O-antigen ligase family protein [candidate division Zixibacteria bacterium]